MPIGRTATLESFFFMCSFFVIIPHIGLGCGTFARWRVARGSVSLISYPFSITNAPNVN